MILLCLIIKPSATLDKAYEALTKESTNGINFSDFVMFMNYYKPFIRKFIEHSI